MTGNSYESDVKLFMAAGLNDLILKPANLNAIIDSITTSVERSIETVSDSKNVVFIAGDVTNEKHIDLKWFYILTTITISLMILPAIYEQAFINDGDSYFSIAMLKSNEYFYGQLIFISIYSLLIMDLMFSYALMYTKSDTFISMASFYTFTYHITLVLYLIPNEKTMLIWILLCIRDYLIGVSLILYLIKNGKPIWHEGYASYLSCLGSSVYIVVREYSFCFCTLNNIFGKISVISCVILFCSLLFNSVRYYHCITKEKHLSVTILGLVLSICGISCAILLPLVANIELSLVDISVQYLMIYDGLVLSCSILTLYIINQRVEIYNSCMTNNDIIKSRQSMVKHIAHDVRNPLTTILLAMTHAQDDYIKHQINTLTTLFNYFENSESQDIILLLSKMVLALQTVIGTFQSCKNSCNEAIDKVCDLVNFEKLESNDFQLELTRVIGINYITKFIDDYKSKNNTMKVIILYNSKDVNNLDNTSINIDVKKMEYVLTTLFSKITTGSEVIVDVMLQQLVDYKKVDSKITTDKTTSITLKITCNSVLASISDTTLITRDLVMCGDSDSDIEYGLLNTDLGLYICHGIIKLHNGLFTLSSDGKEYSISLPALYDNNGIENKLAYEVSIADCHNYFKANPLRILIVDDSLVNRKHVLRSLVSKGICNGTPHVAGDGLTAIEMIEESLSSNDRYDVILMDYEMPIMNGPEACHQCRRLGYTGLVFNIT